MRLSEFISENNLKTEKKPMGLQIHTGEIEDPEFPIPVRFTYMQEWSDAPSRKIWMSQPYRSIILYENGTVSVYEYVRNADFRLQLLDIKEKYASSGVGGSSGTLQGAFEFALDSHKSMHRKCSKAPYITHPMDVASILLKNDAPDLLVIAGFLHDVLEDSKVNSTLLRYSFDDRVADLVMAVSEVDSKGNLAPHEQANWRERKELSIKKLIDAERDVKLLVCADKLANIKDMFDDLDYLGDRMWDYFNARKDEQKWYYTSVVEALKSGSHSVEDTKMFLQLQKYINMLFS
ncbi:(p)ppGpp synthase/HD superfamily hydrolase [Methanohalophilus levihalophilus]|uniref:HD domain-containing protein n=1 Tax=Methanohalophilus levihalophilus TaxID=1431282 RepID=UPI001AE737B7|nr:HD domain-containing protein [Methanohalophilus levihalophilus]MBP2029210.1 (p)ppGpp synthase/HD superfamily hydrolase [Methanohalophilus levihalophilus]